MCIRDSGYIEFCINVGQNAFEHAARAEEIAGYSKKYGVAVSSIGRWGTERLLPDGTVNDEEYRSDLALIDMAAAVGCPVFVCGCNGVKEMSFIDNALLAADYFQKLVDYGAARGVKIAVYNCDWGNVIFDRRGWDIVLPKVEGLGIKYDTSHLSLIHISMLPESFLRVFCRAASADSRICLFRST